MLNRLLSKKEEMTSKLPVVQRKCAVRVIYTKDEYRNRKARNKSRLQLISLNALQLHECELGGFATFLSASKSTL